jgi:DNA-binding NtrC family response regulator
MRLLESYDWPGNVRELENALTRALVLSRTTALSPELFALDPRSRLAVSPGVSVGEGPADLSVSATIHAHAVRVLNATGGNKTQAARLLEISRQRLDRILKREDDEGGANHTAERSGA